MNIERPLTPRTEATTKRIKCLAQLPPFEPGLTAALRRAYAPPPASHGDCFDALLAKLR